MVEVQPKRVLVVRHGSVEAAILGVVVVESTPCSLQARMCLAQVAVMTSGPSSITPHCRRLHVIHTFRTGEGAL